MRRLFTVTFAAAAVLIAIAGLGAAYAATFRASSHFARTSGTVGSSCAHDFH